MKRPFALKVLAIVALLGGPLAHAQAVTPDCMTPAEYIEATTGLPHVADALAHGQLDILAVGSATMLGPDKLPQNFGFPYRMAQALRSARPDAKITLDVESERGLTAAEQLEKMRVAIGRHPYRLVIWQTGTVEAVRNLSPGEFADTLSAGAALAASASADLLLVDPQFSRFLRANANVDPYEAALQQTAALPDVLLFRRYDLMRSWVNDGRIDLEHATKEERLSVAEKLHTCLGQALGQLVLAGAAHGG